MDLQRSATLSMLPWVSMAFGSLSSGFLADALIRTGWRTVHVRKAVQSFAWLVPATCLLMLLLLPFPPTAAAFVLAGALGAQSFG